MAMLWAFVFLTLNYYGLQVVQSVEEGTSSQISNLTPTDKTTTASTSSTNVPENEQTDDVIIIMDDVSEYSSSFLSGLTSIPSIKFKDGRTYSLEVREPDPDDEIMNRARQKMEESSEKVTSTIEELRDAVKKDKTLNAPWENDAWLVRFLRARSYNVGEAHKMIGRYYKFKDRNKFIFEDLVPSCEKDTFEQEVIVPLPIRDQKGRRVIVVRASKWNQKDYPIDRMCKMMALIMELGSYEPSTQLAGVEIILDMKNATREQAYSIAHKISLVNDMLYLSLKCVPLKIDGFHVVNQPSWFWAICKFFKTVGLMRQELSSRLYVHGTNWSTLHEHVKDAYLPFDYGGTFLSRVFQVVNGKFY